MDLIGMAVLLILSGGGAAIALGRRSRLGGGAFRAGVLAGCALAASGAIRVLEGGPDQASTVQPALPGGVWVLGLDKLSAWFLLVIALAGGVATLFGVPYLEPERHHRPVPPAHALWSILLAAMMGVVVAGSAVVFLIAWEVMAVSAYFLIMFEHDREEVRRSGLVYLVLTHVGTLGLIAMFIAWGHAAGSLTFGGFAAAAPILPWTGAGILLLALFGFGIKAGAFPFHFWLPGAHAAAPSHVSALLSGVMLKMGIYGLLRVVVLVGAPPAWWGWTVLLVGLASAVLGVLWALAQHDLKRALAYSSVENIGIILLGLGLGALGTAYHRPSVALLGYAGALLHTLNHALFKSLLFLGAGAVVRETGTREIDRMGGLARRLPHTAVAFLVGAIAIVGLPPLNGFVSEWTLVQGFLDASRGGGPLRWVGLGAAGLGLVAALALACFTRLAGAIFLGQPRDPLIAGSGVVNGLAFPQGLLGAFCLAIGLAPALVLGYAQRVAVEVVGAGGSDRGPLPGSDAAHGLRLFAVSVLLMGLGVWALRNLRRGSTARRTTVTWGCAYAEPTPRMQYTASSYGSPILGAFRVAASRTTSPGRPAEGASDSVLSGAVLPLWSAIRVLARTIRTLQHGRVTTYLQYIVWTLLLMLGFLMFAATGARP